MKVANAMRRGHSDGPVAAARVRTRSRRLLCVAVLALVVGCNACEQEYCSDYLAIVLEKATAWPAGTYEFDIVSDGEATRCSLTLPRAVPDLIGACDDSDFNLGSGEADSIGAINIAGAPDHVDLVISHDGVVFSEGSFEPEYHEPHDWMRRCGPPCDEATVMHELP